MKKDLKLIIESFLVSLAVIMLIVLYFTVQGYITTKKYVPDVTDKYNLLNKYNDTKNLSSTVSFGSIDPYGWTFYLTVFLIVFSLYISIRLGIWRWKYRMRN